MILTDDKDFERFYKEFGKPKGKAKNTKIKYKPTIQKRKTCRRKNTGQK
jgi:hypothetical protein